MTDLARTTRPSPSAQSPDAERLRAPRWRDGRLVAGVVLVLLAVLLGARLVGGAQHSTSVLVAARGLDAGHVLQPADLRVRSIRLSGVTGKYWGPADAPALAGHPLVTAVAEGDLLPRSAVAGQADPKPSRVVSLPVDPGRLPSLSPGDHVDVFATFPAAGGVPGETIAVLRGAEYLGGGDSASGTSVSIRLQVPVNQTAAVVRASQVGALDIVLQQPAGQDTGDVGAAPLSDPIAAPTSPAGAGAR